MQWARDVVGGCRSGTGSARSLLTVMTLVMVAGMVGDRIEIGISVSAISSDAIAGTVIAISTDGNVDVVTIAIGTDVGVADGKCPFFGHRLHRLVLIESV